MVPEVKSLLKKNERGPGADTPGRAPLIQLFIEGAQPRLLERIGDISKYNENNTVTWQEKFVPGKFFLFRSDLLHCVPKHELDSPRLSIATNFVQLTPPGL